MGRKIRAERFVFVAEESHRATSFEGAHRLVRTFVDVAVFSRWREFRVWFHITQKHAIAVAKNVGNEPAALCQRETLFSHGRRFRLSGDREIERVVGCLDILRHVDM